MTKIKLLLASLLCSLALLAAPGDVHKGNLTFVWNPPAPEENVEGYNLYVSTNLPPGVALPINEETLLSVVTPPEATNLFQFYLTIPAPATSVTLTNVWSELGTWAFFTLTASNSVGESTFSNPAALVAPLSGRGGLTVRVDK